MNRGMSILWIVVGAVLVGWGATTDTTWLKWLLITVGVLTLALQAAALIRQSRAG